MFWGRRAKMVIFDGRFQYIEMLENHEIMSFRCLVRSIQRKLCRNRLKYYSQSSRNIPNLPKPLKMTQNRNSDPKTRFFHDFLDFPLFPKGANRDPMILRKNKGFTRKKIFCRIWQLGKNWRDGNDGKCISDIFRPRFS